MGGLSIWHWIIVLVVVLLVFGTKRLRNAGQDLGEAVKGFKKGMKDDENSAEKPEPVKTIHHNADGSGAARSDTGSKVI